MSVLDDGDKKLAAAAVRDVESYARLRARLAAAGEQRAALLTACGLDEERWDVLDDRWQQRLSDAMDHEGDEVPPLLQQFAEAFAQAQRATPGRTLTLELFARCTRALRGARDAKHELRKLGVSFAEYMKANQHWAPQLARDRALAETFQQFMQLPRRS